MKRVIFGLLVALVIVTFALEYNIDKTLFKYEVIGTIVSLVIFRKFAINNIKFFFTEEA